MGNEKMRQKVCFTSIDKDGKLLREKPKSWNEIKSRKLMIINRQHNITTLKEVQISGCTNKHHLELAKWEAYIVWSLDPVKLTSISKFYNSTNHLEHAQPTWGWQIISGHNMWLAHGQPTDKDGENHHCGNGGVLNHSKYIVKSSCKSHNNTSNTSE